MRQVSLTKISGELKRIIIRFPVPVIISLSATYIAILWINTGYQDGDKIASYSRILSVLLIGFPLTLSLVLFAGKQKLKPLYSLLSQILAAGILVFVYSIFPTHPYHIFYLKVSLLVAAFWSLFTFIAFPEKKKNLMYWNFNIRIFRQLISGAFSTLLLFAGLALAMYATEQLFDVHIPGKFYSYLSVLLLGLLYSLIFLSGIPAIDERLRQPYSYPKALKIFVQYILIPIALVYLVILYIYGFKILILWSLPKGWVTYLISGFAALGIFAFILIYPIHRKNPFLHRYYIWFFPLLLPLLLLLSAAIYVRIENYGITVNRYLLIVLFLWLSGTSIYLILNKLRNIIAIPASIFAILLLISFGPWGISRVSINSQIHRLTELLQKNKRFKEGKYVKSSSTIHFEDKKRISSIVSYLCQEHGYRCLQPLFTEDLDSLINESETAPDHFIIKHLMDIPYISPYATTDEVVEVPHFSFDIKGTYYESHSLPIHSYDYLTNFYFQAWGGNKRNQKIAIHDSLRLTYRENSGTFHFYINDKALFDWNLNPLLQTLTHLQTQRYEDYSLTKAQSEALFSTPETDVLILIHHIDGEIDKTQKKPEILINSVQADILFHFKRPK